MNCSVDSNILDSIPTKIFFRLFNIRFWQVGLYIRGLLPIVSPKSPTNEIPRHKKKKKKGKKGLLVQYMLMFLLYVQKQEQTKGEME